MQQPQQQHALGLVTVQGHHSPPGKRLEPGMQLNLDQANGHMQLSDKPSCPEGRCLFNNLVSQLSLAACEAQLEHMALRTSSSSSTSTSVSSRASSVSGQAVSPHAAEGTPRGPDSMQTRSSSTLSPDAFQELLFRMLQEEWSTQVQGSGE